MRTMGYAQGMHPFLTVKFIWKDPEFVPQEVPDREETSRDELAYLKIDAHIHKSKQYKVIEHKVDYRDEGITTRNLGFVSFEVLVVEGPIALQGKVD
jgi:hypothetical protein